MQPRSAAQLYWIWIASISVLDLWGLQLEIRSCSWLPNWKPDAAVRGLTGKKVVHVVPRESGVVDSGSCLLRIVV